MFVLIFLFQLITSTKPYELNHSDLNGQLYITIKLKIKQNPNLNIII